MLKIVQKFHFEEVPDNKKIARYFSREKFERLIKNNTIWFSNAKLFKDMHERQIPESFFSKWPVESRESYIKIDNAKTDVISAFISCWTCFESENYALWKIYNPDSDGVCIVTTVGKLKDQLKRVRDDVITCKVEYIDPDDTNTQIELPWISFGPDKMPHGIRLKEMYKILPYKYENEIRAIIYGRSKEKGIEVSINTCELIDRIYLNPFMNIDDALNYKMELIKTFKQDVFRESIIKER